MSDNNQEVPAGNFLVTDHDIHFVTDREPSSPNRFGFVHSQSLHFGICTVSVPRRRALGTVERQTLKRPEDPTQFLIMKKMAHLTHDAFYQTLDNSDERSALVFIHGFNVRFEDVIFRAAQMKNDLQFQGAMIVFSWPSRGDVADYVPDCEAIKISQDRFDDFLRSLLKNTGSQGYSINLLAHSLGNQLIVNALNALSSESLPKLEHVVFAAPDVASAIVKSRATKFASMAKSVTLYVSSNDWALKASHLLCKYYRAGDSREHIVVEPDITTIDVSVLNTRTLGHAFLGHDYIVANRDILSDLAGLLSGAAFPRFGMYPVSDGNGQPYWTFNR